MRFKIQVFKKIQTRDLFSTGVAGFVQHIPIISNRYLYLNCLVVFCTNISLKFFPEWLGIVHLKRRRDKN